MKAIVMMFRGFARVCDEAIPPLLGSGVDSIIQRTTRAPNDAQRLLRYARAKYVFYAQAAKPSSQLQMLELRKRLGEHYRSAWSAGRFPRFNSIGRPTAIRFSNLRSEARAS